jgi:hypothetical protein
MASPHRALFQAVAPELVEERSALEPEQPGGLTLVSTGPKESALEQTTFHLDIGPAQ